MNLRSINVIYQKELIDALRDRRTLIASIVIPIFLFPLLTIGFGSLAAKSVKKMQQEKPTIMLLGAQHAPKLAASLQTNDAIKILPPAANYVARINDKRLRAAVEIPPHFEALLASHATNPPTVKIYHYAGELRSQFAIRTLQKLLRDYRDQLVAERLATKGLGTDALRPFESREENVAAPEKVGGNIIGGLIPYMIIFLCFVGAMNPAIDLTAGEKERGTMETILASPVSRVDLVAGKFLMVFTASVVTTIISMASFAVTFSLPFLAARELSRMTPGGTPFDLSGTGVAAVLLLMLPLAVMFSAALLALGLLAKSFKEAQSYVSPLMIVVILPAMAAMLPGTEFNPQLALVPILNVSLVSKEVLTGNFPWLQLLLVFGSSCVYAAAALWVAVEAFKRESVLFRS